MEKVGIMMVLILYGAMLDQWEIRARVQIQPCSGPQGDRLEQGWKCLLKLGIAGKAGVKGFRQELQHGIHECSRERCFPLAQYIKEWHSLRN